MSLITATNLGKSFGPRDLFSGVNLSIPQRARAAIVGPNGIGKTTLLRILLGLEPASAGTVRKAKSLRVGYLPQEAVLHAHHSLWQECLGALTELRAMEAELAELEKAMSGASQADTLARYGQLQAEFEHRGGYTYPTRIRQVLTGLGFSPEDYEMPLDQLSGGQRTRAVLARLLLQAPDLLVLDEPTNHLDIAAVEWLESYLGEWPGAVLIVSHDRYFLDKVCNTILEMRRDGMETYRGNYSAYLQQRQERWELRRQQFDALVENLAKDLEYVRRNIAGQNTIQAKGKLKRLSRMIEAIEQVGIDGVQGKRWLEISEEVSTSTSYMSFEEAERRLRGLHAPIDRPPRLNLHLRSGMRSGNLVLRSRDLLVGYPGNPLFTAPDLELRRLECAALIGPNGAGKSTFLKTILDQMPPLQGEVILGASLKISYFAQAHEGLHDERSLMEEIESIAPHLLPGQVRDYLARFLFRGEDVFKQVGMLSGGERGRLALAKLAMSDSNLLLLDEPTNHLDIPSQEILQAVLDEYQGTILLVSHDRYLIDALATQVWEIDDQARTLTVFSGTYSQYRAEKDAQAQAAAAAGNGGPRPREDYRQKLREKNRSQAEERRRKARLDEVEARIAALESELRLLTVRLENPPADPGELRRLARQYESFNQELEARLAEWETLHEEAVEDPA